MPVETTEKQAAIRGETTPLDTPPTSENVPADHEAQQSASPPPDKRPMRRRLLIGALGALVLVALGIFGTPKLFASLNTVSTDDAYVNGHVTFVAARVGGQIARVLVEDNNRVHKGELLAQLDKEPFQDAVAVKKAAVDTAEADLRAATATVRDIEAQARDRRWKLQNAIEDVDNQMATLHARVAALDKSKADLKLAQADFDRAKQLLETQRAGAVNSSTGQRPYRLPGGCYPGWQMLIRFVPLWDCRRSPRRQRSRPSSARSRSDLLFCPRGAGGADPDGGSARRHPFV